MRVSVWLYLLEQSLCCLSLLSGVGGAMGLRRSITWRVAAVSALDGVACLGAAFAGWIWLRLTLLALVLALSPAAAYPGLPVRLRRRMSLQAGLAGLSLTGCVRLIAGLNLPAVLALGAACLLPLLSVCLPGTSAAAPCAGVEITFMGRRVSLNAMVDTGNLLRDPVTCLPVIVCSRQALHRFGPMDDAGLMPGMRLISVKTAAGSALMTLLRPDEVRLRLKSGWKPARALIGLAPEGYSGCQALVPACLTQSPLAEDEHATMSQGG